MTKQPNETFPEALARYLIGRGFAVAVEVDGSGTAPSEQLPEVIERIPEDGRCKMTAHDPESDYVVTVEMGIKREPTPASQLKTDLGAALNPEGAS